MSSVLTNRGKFALFAYHYTAETSVSPEDGFAIALITSAGVGTTGSPVAPTASNCKLWDDVSDNEIITGNGYSAGGRTLNRDGTYWTITEDDANNRAILTLVDITWTASGGNLPLSGNGARYAVLMDLTDDKNIIAVFDLDADRTVSSTQDLRLTGYKLYIN